MLIVPMLLGAFRSPKPETGSCCGTHLMATATSVQALFFPSSETFQHPLLMLRDAQIQVAGDANGKPAYAPAEKLDGATGHSKMPAFLVSAPGERPWRVRQQRLRWLKSSERHG